LQKEFSVSFSPDHKFLAQFLNQVGFWRLPFLKQVAQVRERTVRSAVIELAVHSETAKQCLPSVVTLNPANGGQGKTGQ
jgi:hypothetical protein